MKDIEQIYQQYMPQIYRYLFSLCHDSHLAEELTQETFFQALKTVDKFRGECKIYVWLCQIAKNIWSKEYKRLKKSAGMESAANFPIDSETPDETVVRKETIMEIYKSIQTLNESMREVMYLRLSGEFSFKEIGEILGKDENWARVTFYRGKEIIRRKRK